MSSEETAAGAARHTALNLLARREHAPLELRRKLVARGHEAATVDALLTELATEGLLSETRYAEVYANGRFERGYGPLRIRAELREHGVPVPTVSAILANFDELWMPRLAELARRRFGAAPPDDVRERARRTRFLLQRGYTAGQIERLFRAS